MRIGKLDNDVLETLVLSKFQAKRVEVVTASGVGEDCAVLDFGQDLIVLSCDPVTSAKWEHLGLLSVHVNCNDAAASGAEPVGLLVTLLAPPDMTEQQLGQIADDLAKAAADVGVDILGGHTEVTDSVTRAITCSTVIGKQNRAIQTGEPKPGDALIMTKWAGLEGSAIIAGDFPHLCGELPTATLTACKGFSSLLSVMPECRVAVQHGASIMHDITEGGVLGAAWELGYREGLGLAVDPAAIPVREETLALCAATGINPHRLIGSGSLLLICENGAQMCEALHTAGIPANQIGRVTESGFTDLNGNSLPPPEADELYKLF